MRRNIKQIPGKFCRLFVFLISLFTLSAYSVNGAKIQEAPNYQQQQKIKVTGSVTTVNGEPLVGVTIVVNGTTNGTVTNTVGFYEIECQINSVLSFSFIGYTTKEVVIENGGEYNITLADDITEIEDIVVVGYGTQKKSDLTGAVSVVNVSEMQKKNTASVSTALRGLSSGVMVKGGGAPGESPSIFIRGIGTFNNNSPLIIVDGIPIDKLDMVDPNDIESLQVLKDASSAAIYGSRAAGGVIIITTKKGAKSTEPVVTYEGSIGFQELPKRWDMMNREQYQQMVRDACNNDGNNDYGEANNPDSPAFVDSIDTDWQNEAFRRGQVTKHYLGVTGGTDKSNYSFSLGYNNQKPILNSFGPDYTRYNFKLGGEHKVGRVKLGANAYLTSFTHNGFQSQGAFSGIINILKAPPTLAVYDENNKGGYAGVTEALHKVNQINQIGYNNLFENQQTDTRALANTYMQIEILKGLTYKISAGYDGGTWYSYNFMPKAYLGNDYNYTVAKMSESRGFEYHLIADHVLNYNKTIGKHSLSLMSAYSAEKREWSFTHASGEGYREPYSKVIEASEADTRSAGGIRNASTLASIIGRINYNYDDKYLFQANIRQDKSSKFAEGFRTGLFPSVSVGWKISNESFFDVEQVNSLKIRGGYGKLGNNAIGDYLYQVALSTNQNYSFGGNVSQGMIQNSVSNSTIQWETSESYNIGADAGLFQNKLQVSFDYYQKKSYDILYAIDIPFNVGSTGKPMVNTCTVKNSGVEVEVKYKLVLADVVFDIGGNLTTINNEVLQIGLDNEPIIWNTAITEVGRSMGENYGFVVDGIFQSIDEINAVQPDAPEFDASKHAFQSVSSAPGDIKFKDIDGNGIIDNDDKTYLGPSIPKFVYGFNFGMSYRKFDFSVLLNGQYGNYIYNQVYSTLTRLKEYDNQLAEAANYWSESNTNTDIPRPTMLDPNANNRVSDRYVESGAYLKINTLQLGYTLDKSLIKQLNKTSLRVYLSVNNLYTITKYSGYDPEFSAGIFDSGFDLGKFPSPRIMNIGVKANF